MSKYEMTRWRHKRRTEKKIDIYIYTPGSGDVTPGVRDRSLCSGFAKDFCLFCLFLDLHA